MKTFVVVIFWQLYLWIKLWDLRTKSSIFETSLFQPCSRRSPYFGKLVNRAHFWSGGDLFLCDLSPKIGNGISLRFNSSYLHSLNATEDDNADVNEGYICVLAACRHYHQPPNWQALCFLTNGPLESVLTLVDTEGNFYNCPTFNACHWCELAGVHVAQNKYWRDHIFRQAIDYCGQWIPMIDWLLYTQV